MATAPLRIFAASTVKTSTSPAMVGPGGDVVDVGVVPVHPDIGQRDHLARCVDLEPGEGTGGSDRVDHGAVRDLDVLADHVDEFQDRYNMQDALDVFQGGGDLADVGRILQRGQD